jgi:hypothetical protein
MEVQCTGQPHSQVLAVCPVWRYNEVAARAITTSSARRPLVLPTLAGHSLERHLTGRQSGLAPANHNSQWRVRCQFTILAID